MKTQAKPNILLIYTGGTIGMMKDFETGALKAFNLKKWLKKTPEPKRLVCKKETISFPNHQNWQTRQNKQKIELTQNLYCHAKPGRADQTHRCHIL